MSRLAAIAAASGGIARHKVQAIVICAVLLASTASATLGFALLAAINAPYQHAFDARHGVNVTVTVDTSRASARQLAGTGALPGVTAVAGPFAEATVRLDFDGRTLGPRTLAGRASPEGSIDQVVLSEGHWPTGPGQLVLDAGPGGGRGYPGVGDTVTVLGGPGVKSLTVVGFAISITKTADGWVAPAQVAALRDPQSPPSAQMLYRLADAGTDAGIRAGVTEISNALPRGAVVASASWLTVERTAAGNAALMEPFLLAFALIGLVLAALIVGNVVSGAVVAQYRRIGVLKSIGLTPAQVVAVYLGRVGVPAVLGCLAGAVAGNALAIPVLGKSSGIYGVGHQQVPWWASAAAVAGMLALTMLAALGPAMRAGRLSAIQAISAGQAPRAGRGYVAHRLIGRLPLPRPASIGLAAPFARPARTLVTLAVITFGATAVAFAVGVSSALGRAVQAQSLAANAPVQIQRADQNAVSAPDQAQDKTVIAALDAQPGTAKYLAVYGTAVKVPAVSVPVNAQAYAGDATWLGNVLISGHWYSAPGEAVVNTAFLTDSALAVGDTTTVRDPGVGAAPVSVRIVGEVFDPSTSPWLFTGPGTLPTLTTARDLRGYDVSLRPGTNADSYVNAVNTALGDASPWQAATPRTVQFYGTATDLLDLLALIVAVTAALGVFNTVLMTTRDRVRDLGTYKAIGMRPGQLLTMVVCQTAVPALIAAIVAAPAAIALTDLTVRAMAATARTGIPAEFTQVFPPSRLALLSLGALAIAVAGALLPAIWAARARPATALRTE